MNQIEPACLAYISTFRIHTPLKYLKRQVLNIVGRCGLSVASENLGPIAVNEIIHGGAKMLSTNEWYASLIGFHHLVMQFLIQLCYYEKHSCLSMAFKICQGCIPQLQTCAVLTADRHMSHDLHPYVPVRPIATAAAGCLCRSNLVLVLHLSSVSAPKCGLMFGLWKLTIVQLSAIADHIIQQFMPFVMTVC